MLTLWSSGSNAHGQLSNGSLEDSHIFKPCSFLGCPPGTLPKNTRQALNVVSGANHTLILLETRNDLGETVREIWGSGDGSVGQLGTAYHQLIKAGQPSTIFRPIHLPLQQKGLAGYQVKLMSTSWETTYVVLSCESKKDVLISMGANDFGDLGVGGIDKKKYDQGSLHIVEFGHLVLDELPLKNAEITVQSIDSGQRHVVVQLQATWDQTIVRTCLVGWGTSRHGQLGTVLSAGGRPVSYLSTPHLLHTDDTGNRILHTALGSQHTVFLHASGEVTGLGSNRKGQLQGLEGIKGATQIGCTWNGTYIVTNENDGKKPSSVLATGSGFHGQLGRRLPSDSAMTELPSLDHVELPIPTNSHISAMACGTEHVLVHVTSRIIETTSEVWGWGWNEHGTLGNGTTVDIFMPIKIWPPEPEEAAGSSPKAVGIWAGSGTSWIVTRS